MLQEAWTFFLELLAGAELMTTSLVSKHVRQSTVADSGPESTVLSCESPLKSDSLPLWSGIIHHRPQLQSLYHNLWCSLQVSAASLSSQSAAALPGLEGRGNWKAQAPVVWDCELATGMDGQSIASTTDAAFLSASIGPLATLTFRCAAWWAVPVSCAWDWGWVTKTWVPN